MNLKLPDGLHSKGRALLQFFMAQGLAMAANLLYGLLCVRLLPPGEYAKFVVVFGVQGTLLLIMDANLSGTLIPLIGERVGDRRLIADYVATLRQLAFWAYLFVCGCFIFIYPQLVKHRNWNWRTVVAMIGILLVSTWALRVSTLYGAVLIMLRDRGWWYRGQLISALGTLALLLISWAGHWLSAFQAIIYNVIGLAFVACFYWLRARKLLSTTGQISVEKRGAIIRLALPSMPGALFYAVQGQIPLFLITFLGHTTGVAGIGALARLGQIFSLLQQGNPLLVEPYFAKLPKERLLRSYTITLLLGAVLSFVIFSLSVTFPQVFLWILGPQYAGLAYEVRLVIAASSVSFVNGLLWTMHTARRFVYWWTLGANLGFTLLVQVAFIRFSDVGTLRSVLWMGLAMNIVSICISLACGVWGFARGPRETERPQTSSSVEAIEAAAVLGSTNSVDGTGI
jgi:O-antigen/teichoic acid export membrane protein